MDEDGTPLEDGHGDEHVRLDAAHVGRRVVLRHLLPGGSATDVLGVLERWDERVVVRRRDGERREVSRADVVAAKPVPPPPRPRAGAPTGVLALEEVLAGTWVAPEVARSGRWLLRAGRGVTGRSSSVLPLGAPGLPLADALDRAGSWYAARGLPLRLAVPRPVAAPGVAVPSEPALADVAALDRLLDGRGFSTRSRTLVLVAPRAQLAAALPPAAAAGPAVEVTGSPGPGWSRLAHGGLPASAQEVLDHLLVSAPRQAFAAVDGPAPRAVGRVAAASGWAVLGELAVAQDARRRGLARAVLAALVAWAAGQRLREVALQVAADNVPALALYESLGLVVHHEYVYRDAPGARSAA